MSGVYWILAILAILSWLLSLITVFQFGRLFEKRNTQLFYLSLLDQGKSLINKMKGFEYESGNADASE